MGSLTRVKKSLGAVSIFVVLSLFKDINKKTSQKPKARIQNQAKNN